MFSINAKKILMIIKYLKNSLKSILNKYGYEIIKKNKSKYNTYDTPSKELIDTLIASKGILHIGGHRGDETHIYNWFGKNVIWFEANPEIFEHLKKNVSKFKGQTALNSLLLDKVGQDKEFFISSNDAASSSIFHFGELSTDNKKKIWFNKNLFMKKKIMLKSNTLDQVIIENNININNFDHWVIDIQGSELLFLAGSENSLKHCKSIYIEISQGEVYKNGAQFNEIKKYLNDKNFFEVDSPKELHCDLLFLRKQT